MLKYNEGLAGQTVPYIEDGSYNISGIREMPDISRKTFYERQATKPESGKAIKEATGRFEGKPVMTATRRPNGNRKKRREKCYLCHFFLTKAPPTSPKGGLRLRGGIVGCCLLLLTEKGD